MAYIRSNNIISSGGSNAVFGTAPNNSTNANVDFTVNTGLSSISEFVMVGWANSQHTMRKYCYYKSSIPNVYDSVTADAAVGISFGSNAAGLTITNIVNGDVYMKTGSNYRYLYDAIWFAKQ